MQVIRMGIRVIQGANNLPRSVVYGTGSNLLPAATTGQLPSLSGRTESTEDNKVTNESPEDKKEIKQDEDEGELIKQSIISWQTQLSARYVPYLKNRVFRRNLD